MKAVIFAGGAGTRLWPLSRRHSPKQFEKVIGDKSTLQLSVEKLLPLFNWEDIYIATALHYSPAVLAQLPEFRKENLILEPVARDVGPAVGLTTAVLMKKFPDTPFVILWSDHLVKKQELFLKVLETAGKMSSKKRNKLFFISQKPRFASQNLGWIEYGDMVKNNFDLNLYSFKTFNYRPTLEEATGYLKRSNFAWNLGYFVTTPSFLWRLYKQYQPEMFIKLQKISDSVGKKTFSNNLSDLYPQFSKISFDNAILEKINKESAYVICEDFGWSDVGAWEALKEALQKAPEQNVTRGKVLVTDCEDSLVYNYTDQLVVTIDLKGFIVINTHDAVLVCHKNSVPKIKHLVEKLANSQDNHLV